MAIDDMNIITNKTESLKTADFDTFKTALVAAGNRDTPATDTNIDTAVDQMVARWKNSTKKSISNAEWDAITLLCRKIYYQREDQKTTLSRGIWPVLKDNIL
ncbi:hypothetical protein LCGC14_0537260 [marine sediment metagenome]|uniref:Uncharacterized protein n=1 Tax=marine sediment metagenome TaxID=412755 RepID=A0A0F9UF92_9ZZZZ